jgi:hypothetical protein
MRHRGVLEKRYPVFHDTFSQYFWAYFEDSVVDATQPLDQAVAWRLETGELPQLEAEVRQMLDDSPDESSAMANLMSLLAYTGVPDGSGYRDWLQGVHKRIFMALVDPDGFPTSWPEDDGRDPDRLGELTRKGEAIWELANPVLDVHERQLETWGADRGGFYRQHYYLPDIGQPSGTVVTHFDSMEAIPVRGVGVVVRWDPRESQPVLEDVHAELSFDVSWRERYPDLCHVFGGYFAQKCAHERDACMSRYNFLLSTTDPGRSRVREQLDELLTLDDIDLAVAVRVLGCALRFEQPRLWVERMRWAMDAYDWKDPEEA